jgi:hypothetical protein
MDETVEEEQPDRGNPRRRRRRRFLGRVGAAGASAPGPIERTRSYAFEGERSLRRAVLMDAVTTMIKHRNAQKPRGRRLFAEANEWVAADDRGWPFSFVNICDALDLSVARVRSSIDELCSPVRRTAASTPAPAVWEIAARYEAAS